MKRMLLVAAIAALIVGGLPATEAAAGPLRRVGKAAVRVVTFGRRGCHARHSSCSSEACSASACASSACASSTTDLAVPPPPSPY